MKQFKVTYNYPESASYENECHWLVGREIVEAETYMEAQKIFRKLYPSKVIRDINIINEEI